MRAYVVVFMTLKIEFLQGVSFNIIFYAAHIVVLSK